MKRLLLLSALALFLHASSWAYDFSAKNDDGKTIYYNVTNAEELTCEVTYLSTSNSNNSAYQGSVVIPTTVNNESTTYSVTEIGDRAFSGCTALTATTIPNSVTSIGERAFYGCTALTEITIPNSVETIGGYAFYECTGLTSVTIPESVTKIGQRAFEGCTGLTEVNFNAKACTSAGSDSSNRAFYGCTNVSKVNFGNNVTIIPGYLCYEMTGLTGKLTIPYSVTTIGSSAFYKCTGLTGELIIPNSVTEIGVDTFYRCTGLTGELIIPNSVTTIGGGAFEYCRGLKSVTIGNSVETIGSYAFDYCTGLTSVTIPNSVTTIGIYAFKECSGLTEITIPESVTSIGSDAFYYCTGLREVNFNATACTSAGSTSSNMAFCGCSNISTVNFGDNVTIIPDYLCYIRTGLTAIAIPNSVTTIGQYAFSGCTGLTSIYSLNPEPPKCGSSAFANVPTSTCVLYVPEGALGAYANASTWKDFYNIVEIEADAIADILEKGDADVIGYYTLDGKMIVAPQRGMNIIRYSDGTSKKVLIR